MIELNIDILKKRKKIKETRQLSKKRIFKTKCFKVLVFWSIEDLRTLFIARTKKQFYGQFITNFIKGTLSGLRQFLATEIPLKMIKMLFISRQKLFSFL